MKTTLACAAWRTSARRNGGKNVAEVVERSRAAWERTPFVLAGAVNATLDGQYPQGHAPGGERECSFWAGSGLWEQSGRKKRGDEREA